MNHKINPFIFDSDFKSDEMHLIIQGNPIGKGRPRVTTRGGFARAYTPRRTADYESSIVTAYKQQIPSNYKLEGPIKANIKAYFKLPNSTTKKDKALMLSNIIKHTHKPDIDNIEKSILDALNGLAYEDDSQIVKLSAEKFYSEYPRLELYMKEYRS